MDPLAYISYYCTNTLLINREWTHVPLDSLPFSRWHKYHSHTNSHTTKQIYTVPTSKLLLHVWIKSLLSLGSGECISIFYRSGKKISPPKRQIAHALHTVLDCVKGSQCNTSSHCDVSHFITHSYTHEIGLVYTLWLLLYSCESCLNNVKLKVAISNSVMSVISDQDVYTAAIYNYR